MIVCIQCKEEKDDTQFRWRSKQRGEHGPRCKLCDASFRKAYHAAHPEKAIARNKKALEKRKLGIETSDIKIRKTKICVDCKKRKSISKFRWLLKAAGQVQARCKTCDAEYRAHHFQKKKIVFLGRNDRRRKSRYEFINELKNKPCTDCGQKFDPCVMDFDHLDPKTKRCKISRLVQMQASKHALLEEISKCELVCANCHRLRTKRRYEYEHEYRKPRSCR